MSTHRYTLRRSRSWAAVLLLGAVMAAPVEGAAQERPRGERDRAELEERIRARFAELVKRRLGLTDAQERTLADVVASFQDERRALWRRQRELRRRVRSLDLDEPPVSVDPAEARAILDEMAAVRAEEVRLFRSEQEALLRVLTPVQLLQFHDLCEDMADRIRRARGRRGGDDDGPRRGRGPGGGPPAPSS